MHTLSMHLIIINLARATERRATMERQCAALGLVPEFLDATDGRVLSDADRALVDHTARKRITPYPLSDNEIGCALSHRRAMQRIIDNNWPMAVIIEDDAKLSPEFPAILAAIENLRFPFDVIDLHRNGKRGGRCLYRWPFLNYDEGHCKPLWPLALTP